MDCIPGGGKVMKSRDLSNIIGALDRGKVNSHVASYYIARFWQSSRAARVDCTFENLLRTMNIL